MLCVYVCVCVCMRVCVCCVCSFRGLCLTRKKRIMKNACLLGLAEKRILPAPAKSVSQISLSVSIFAIHRKEIERKKEREYCKDEIVCTNASSECSEAIDRYDFSVPILNTLERVASDFPRISKFPSDSTFKIESINYTSLGEIVETMIFVGLSGNRFVYSILSHMFDKMSNHYTQ